MASEQPKITLHWLNGSRAHSILWLLEELQVSYDVKVYHRQSNMLAPPELEKVHTLGKSPVVTIEVPGSSEPIVLAESGFIFTYLCNHFGQGKTLVPKQWKDGQEGKMLGETDEWMSYQYFMYYAEGSFMPVLVQYLLMSAGKSSSLPFIVRPITGAIGGRIISMFVFPNLKKHFTLLEQQLEKSGDFLTGPNLTGADIQISYGLIAGKLSYERVGKWDKGSARNTFPKLFAYMDRLEAHPGYQKAVAKTKEFDNGKFSLTPDI